VLQTGSPEEIYGRPSSARVARMLGRPAINLLSADEAAALGLPLQGRKRVGIRPETWRLTADPAGPAIAAVVEHQGPHLAVVLELQGLILRATAPATLRAKAGDRFRLGIEPSGLLYFDA
jgi:ABC-type sugar transport system ATPase subunit